MPAGVSAYIPLANVTLSSSAATVTFSSISQSYRDLVLISQASSVTGTVAVLITINNDNSSNAYSNIEMSGNGTAVATTAGDSYFYAYAALSIPNMPSTSSWLGISNFMDYSATDKHKTILTRSNVAGIGVNLLTSRYKSTSAVTSIKLAANGTSFAAGSTFALYGVSA
jgi:hypothetical protein